jgi:hypothetical protein
MAWFRSQAILLVIVFLCGAGSASAWGHEGHRIVAKIAAKRLTVEARGKLAAILETSDSGLEEAMASASTWPDTIDRTATGTANWHFIDVPVTAPFSIVGLCPQHKCVIDQIVDMTQRLGMNLPGFVLPVPPVPARPMTSQEAAFLIHFVGDIHQPLHAANNGDRGGNCIGLLHPIAHSDGSAATNDVHAAWDVDEVLSVMKALGDEDAVAAKLFGRFTNGASVQQLTPVDWAHESNDLAKRDVYQKLHVPAHTAPPGQCASGIAKVNVTSSYLTANVPDVERQLMRAGIRLGTVLNQTCAGQGCRAEP